VRIAREIWPRSTMLGMPSPFVVFYRLALKQRVWVEAINLNLLHGSSAIWPFPTRSQAMRRQAGAAKG
jgi:hypothetical protein